MIETNGLSNKYCISAVCSLFRSTPGSLRSLLQLMLLFIGWIPITFASQLNVQLAVDLALKTDAELIRLQLAENAANEQSVAAGQLPDPAIKLGLLNFPSDTLAFDQEPMTQFRLGLIQQFPAGDTLDIRSEQVYLRGQANRILRADRQLKVRRDIQRIWLEIAFWQQNQAVLSEDRALFKQLIDVTQSLYGVGRVNQQDVLRAELELSRLEDRALNARLKEQEFRAKLGRWIGPENKNRSIDNVADEWQVPGIEQAESTLLSHPQIQLLDLEVDISGKTLELTRQNYKPKWAAEIGYGWRDGKNSDGSSRADFLSASVSVNLPLFTDNRQDRSSRAAQIAQEASRYKRQDLLLSLTAQVDIDTQRERQFRERAALYQQEIIPRANAQTTASMNSYQADTAPFSDVIRAALQAQRLRLDLLKIELQRRQAVAQLQYLLPQSFSVQTPIKAHPSDG